MKAPIWPALALSAFLLTACAGGPAGGRHEEREPAQFLMSADALLFAGFDEDRDLRVSGSEIEAGVAGAFARADVNHDAILQPVEFASWSAEALGGLQMPPYRLDFDRNVDNEITAEEFAGELRARAREYDRDEDGVIVRAEFLRPAPGARALRPQGPPGVQGMPPNGERRR